MISRANYLRFDSFLRYLAEVAQVSRDSFERYTSYLKPRNLTDNDSASPT